ncbi:MAG: signal peptidase I [Candidatus Aenigmatarchaeota archaeon]
MKKFLIEIIYILIGAATAFAIYYGLSIVLNTDMPIVAVESNSMVPVFYKGDLLVLKGVEPDELNVGDVIVFSPSSETLPIVHRIIYINPDGTFQTKGDANIGQLPFEKAIRPESIHGKMIAIIPALGWVKIGINQYIIPNILWILLIFIIAYGLNSLMRR